jgi:hypothetical protein
MKTALSTLAIVALCSACAQGASAEIPHPPFTADRFQEFVTRPIFECLHEWKGKADTAGNIWRHDRNRPDLLSTDAWFPEINRVDGVYYRELDILDRQLNDCYIAAQIKWGVTQPLSYDQFSRMEDVIKGRCDKPTEERMKRFDYPSGKSESETQAIAKLRYIVDVQNQCYRDAQTQWGFR